MVIPWQWCRTIGPLLSQRFLLASAEAQPRGGFFSPPFNDPRNVKIVDNEWLMGPING